MNDWILTIYWYLTKVNPLANEKKYYAVYIVQEKSTGKYFVGTHHGRIGTESTGGTFRDLKSYGNESQAFSDAKARVRQKTKGG